MGLNNPFIPQAEGGIKYSDPDTLAIDTGHDFGWTGLHVFESKTEMSDLMPLETNKYNLGSNEHRWGAAYIRSAEIGGLHVLGAANIDGNLLIGGAFGLAGSMLEVNTSGQDVDVIFSLYRETGGPFYLVWNGEQATTTKPLVPSDFGIHRISDTEPDKPFAGMVWLDP